MNDELRSAIRAWAEAAQAEQRDLQIEPTCVLELLQLTGEIQAEIGLLRDQIGNLTRQRDAADERAQQAEARDMILSSQLTTWEAQCTAQVLTARALLDYVGSCTEPAGDSRLVQLADRLNEAVTTDAGRLLLRKLEEQGRQLLRAESLAIAAAIVLRELGEGGIPEHTRMLFQSVVRAFEAGKELQMSDPTTSPQADPTVIVELRRIATFAAQLRAGDWEDDEGREQLEVMILDLDAKVAPGLAIGRFLQFQVADGEATYLIDGLEELRVHCLWIPNPDEREADPVDVNGYCLRTVAEAQCLRHDEKRAKGWL